MCVLTCAVTIQKRRQLLIVFQPIFSFLTSSTMSTFQHCRPVNPVGLVKSKKYEMTVTDTVLINIKLDALTELVNHYANRTLIVSRAKDYT